MRRIPDLSSALGLLFFLLLGTGFYPARSQAGDVAPRSLPRILVVYSGDRLLPANALFDESLRHALGADADTEIECNGEFLDQERFPDHYRERMRDFLAAEYRGRPPDVIIAVGSPSLEFCRGIRPAIFPGVPVVYAVPSRDSLAQALTDPGVTGVRSRFDLPATLHLALRLHPRTRLVFLLASAAGEDSTLPEPASTLLRASTWPVPIHVLSRHRLSELLAALRELPANSVVIDLADLGNGADPLFPAPDAMRRIPEDCPAPIYGLFDPLVAHGLVGAVTTPVEEIGRATGAMVREVLAREGTDSLPPVQELAATPVFDWRQVRRFGLRRAQLPPGSIVRLEPPSFWRQHLLLVVVTSLVFLVQSGLIFSLVLQSRRRHRAEIEVRRRREELAHMTRVATMGELTASLAHEINQPLTAILSNAQAAQRLLDAGPAQMGEIREILSDIAADDRRAGEVIRRMRTLIRKGEFTPATLELNELVAEVVGLLRGEMILQNVTLALDLAPRPLRVQGDRVQVQQVLLNLMVNAMDAMKEAANDDRRLMVRTASAPGHAVEVSVSDRGPGVPAEGAERIFEPLYTTKPQGLGLGLAICRSIIQAHGGSIGTRNNPDHGATFWFTLPASEESGS